MIGRGRSGRDRKNLQRGHTTFLFSRRSALAAAAAYTWKYSVCLSVLLFSRLTTLSFAFAVPRFLCLFLPLPLAITVSIRFAIALSHWLRLAVSQLALTRCFSLALARCFSLSLSLSLARCFLTRSRSLFLTRSRSLFLTRSCSLFVTRSRYSSVCVSLSLSRSLALSISVSLSPSLLSPSLSLSLSLSFSYAFKTYPVGPSTMWTYRWSSRQRQLSACVVGQMIYGAIPREFSASFSPRTFQRSLTCKSSRL